MQKCLEELLPPARGWEGGCLSALLTPFHMEIDALGSADGPVSQKRNRLAAVECGDVVIFTERRNDISPKTQFGN